MIKFLKIKQFKSLRSLDIELGKVNLLIGANGSGKSNLLEALGVLGAAAYGRVDDESLLRRGVRPGVPRLYKSAFPQKKQETVQHILFEAASPSSAYYRTTLWNPIENPSPAWRFKTENLASGLPGSEPLVKRSTTKKFNQEQGIAAYETARASKDDPALVLLNELRDFAIFSPNTPGLRGLSLDPVSRDPVGLYGARLAEAVEELVLEARKSEVVASALEEARDLIDWAADFKSRSAMEVPLSPSAAKSRLVVQFTDRFMAKGRNTLTGYDASEGALYVLFLAVLALHSKSPSVFAVDNFDQALNPRLAKKLTECLTRWAKVHDRQLLLTAHNPAILDGLPIQNDEVRLFSVARDTDGATQIERVDLEKALAIRGDSNMSLSQMWMSGLLGAVPNV